MCGYIHYSSANEPFTDSNFSFIGYIIENSTINHKFINGSGPFLIALANMNANYSFSSRGLNIIPVAAYSRISIKPNTPINASTILIHIEDLQNIKINNSAFIGIQFNQYPKGNDYYALSFTLRGDGRIFIQPMQRVGQKITEMERIVLDYDLDIIDVITQIDEDVMRCGINGIEYEIPINYSSENDNTLQAEAFFGSGPQWTPGNSFNISYISISRSLDYHYYDKLHKTITPWGYDFTFSTQFHADRIHPDHLSLLADLTKRYGIKGEIAAWMDTTAWIKENYPDVQYSIKTNESYKNRLKTLQQLGWDISLHSVTPNNSNRSILLPLISEFESVFGNFKSLVEHDDLRQNIENLGCDPSSDYFIADFLIDNDIMIWVNEEWHSESKVMDLNKDQIYYNLYKYPKLNLLKTSKSGISSFITDHQSSYGPLTLKDIDDKFKPFAADGAVIIAHDYTYNWFYSSKFGINYSYNNYSSTGYPYEMIPAEERILGGNFMRGGTWKILDPVLIVFDTMKNYNIWHATPRSIWNRSRYIQNMSVAESETAITITNPSPINIEGLTLTSIEEPKYVLISNGFYYYPTKGANNWHFVIDEIPHNAKFTFQKAPIPGKFPSLLTNSIPAVIWGNSKHFWIYAQKSGECRLNPAFDLDDYEVLNSTTGEIIPHIGSISFNATMGCKYLIHHKPKI
jgi:hypothetical protein